ncbi:hypothetical protein JTB14_020890 [Gonioctena quinquepunctata]|nr:hypothetical protein JTB14_020890 [Gonioctena quinquepunctata]
MKQTIKDKEDIIDSKNEIIKMLQEKLSSYENKQQLPLSYAEIASNNYEPKQEQKYNFPEIIIKPKLPQNAMQTKNDISSNIKPADLKIGVKNLRTTKNGAVIIKCSSKLDTEILETTMKDKLKAYNVHLSKMRNPRIKITNFTDDISTQEIEKNISEQNQVEGIKVTYVKHKKKF